MVGYLSGRAAQKLDHGVVAEVELVGALQVNDPGQRDDMGDAGLVSGEAERELASGRVPHHDDSGCIQVMPLGILQKKLIGRTDVGKRSGPRPTFVAHAPEFEIGCSQSLRSQRCAEVPGVIEIVFRPPVTSVDIDDQWIW